MRRQNIALIPLPIAAAARLASQGLPASASPETRPEAERETAQIAAPSDGRTDRLRGRYPGDSLHPDPKADILLRCADDLEPMVEDGDAIGDHSYSHRDFAKLSKGA